jgi:hypothetical protein
MCARRSLILGDWRRVMAKQSRPQKKTMERVMHEFKHGELETRGGRKVKSRRQAVAIGLSESGSSKYASKRQNERNLRRSKEKEHKGETAMQEKEGKGSLRKLDNSGRGPVQHRTGNRKRRRARRDDPATSARARKRYAEAGRRSAAGRSKMTEAEVERVVPPAQA